MLPPAINDLLGGHVTAVLAEYAPLASHLQAGSFHALATTGQQRIAQLPEIPTVAESGYGNYEVDFWWGLFAPAKTPHATVSQMAELFMTTLRAPEMQPKLSLAGFSPVGKCGADFAAVLRDQSERYGRVIREAKIRAD